MRSAEEACVCVCRWLKMETKEEGRSETESGTLPECVCVLNQTSLTNNICSSSLSLSSFPPPSFLYFTLPHSSSSPYVFPLHTRTRSLRRSQVVCAWLGQCCVPHAHTRTQQAHIWTSGQASLIPSASYSGRGGGRHLHGQQPQSHDD